MKPIPLAFLAAMVGAAHVFSQDEKPVDFREASAPSAVARVLGTIPDGTPPPPEPPKPGFAVRARNILKTETHEQGGRTITLQQIAPIQLPPPPAEAPPVDITDPEIQQRIAGLREAKPAAEVLCIGASVFRAKDSPPRTLVSFWQRGGGGSVTFWSSADFALLSGFSSFIASDGNERCLMLAWSNIQIDRLSDLMKIHWRAYAPPEIPDLPEGNATYTLTSGKPDAATFASIQFLHDLYNNEHDKLKAAYQGREKARLQQEAELRAHPPKPKDIVLNYWRIGDARPATDQAAKGGGQ